MSSDEAQRENMGRYLSDRRRVKGHFSPSGVFMGIDGSDEVAGRDTAIGEDDLVNLKIAFMSARSFEEFLRMV